MMSRLMSSPVPGPLHKRRVLVSIGLLTAGTLLLFYGFQAVAFLREHNGSASSASSWTWLDWLEYQADQASSGDFEGWLHVPDSGVLWVENNTGAQVTLTVNAEQVYQGTGTAAVSLPELSGETVNFRFAYVLTSGFPADGQLGLAEEGIAGIRYAMTPWSFAPPGEEVGGSSLLTGIARPLSLIVLALGLLLMISALRLSRRQWLGLALILGLSLAVRFIILSEKAANDPGFWQMATVWDNFVVMSRNLMRGQMTIAGTYYPQGHLLYIAFAQMIVGPNILGVYRLHVIAGACVPVLLTLAGWALFSRPAGYLAGMLAALYAPLAHFQTTLLLDSGAVILMSLLLIFVVAFYRWRWWLFAALAGLFVGLLTLFRGSFAPLGLWPLLAIALMAMPWRKKWVAAALVTLFAALPILPIVVTNFNAGHLWLTPSRSDLQLLRANNRDANGFNTVVPQTVQLADLREASYVQALEEDIQRYPTRIFELTLRRLALFFEPFEHSADNHAAYVTTGLAYSPTLHRLSLSEAVNFRVMCLLAVAALVVGWTTRWRRGLLVAAAGIPAFILTVVFLYVEGRTRIAGAVPVLLLAGAFPALVWEMRHDRQLVRRLVYATATCGLLLLSLSFVLSNFPRPKTTTPDSLPDSFVPVSGTYNDEIRLLGYGYFDSDFNVNGYLTFELYWQPLRRPSQDYTVTFRFVNGRTKQVDAIYNTTLAIHAPDVASSHWEPGRVYIDRYLFKFSELLPEAAGGEAYDVFVGLYDTGADRLVPLTDATAEVRDDHLRLTGDSLHDAAPAAAGTPAASAIVWGDALALQSIRCRVGDGLSLNLHWQVLRRADHPWHFFAHVFDAGGTLVAQQDGPLDDSAPLDAWAPGQEVDTATNFDGVQGPVRVEIGFYDPFSDARWEVTQGANAANDAVTLACDT